MAAILLFLEAFSGISYSIGSISGFVSYFWFWLQAITDFTSWLLQWIPYIIGEFATLFGG